MGASNHHANVDKLNHCHLNIWPLIEDRNLTLNLFGTIPNGVQSIKFKRSQLHDLRFSLRNCYRNLDIVINPVRYGSGLKIKSVEAIAHGLPLVTTEEGASGISLLDGKSLITAVYDKAFATPLNRLSDEAVMRRNMAMQGLHHIATHLTTEFCFLAGACLRRTGTLQPTWSLIQRVRH